MLALTVTAMVGLGIAGMMGAVSTGIAARTDHRAVMTFNHAANARLTSYVAPSRCFLDAGADRLVLWNNDGMENGVINVTEIRWLVLDLSAGTLTVSRVVFPDALPRWQRELMDMELPTTTNWASVLTHYTGSGYMRSRILAEGIESGSFTIPTPSTLNANHALLRLSINHEGREEDVLQTLTIAERR